MLENKTIVVFGGSGRLGSDLVPLLKNAGANVICPSHSEVDVAVSRGVWEVISQNRPDIVLNLAAYTDVAGAETHTGKWEAVRVNMQGSQLVCQTAHEFGSKVVYISTDYVYPGTKGPYRIEDADPQNNYGLTKFLGESYCDKKSDLIIRTSLKSRDTWSENTFTKVFHPVLTNADWVDVIAKKIAEAIVKEKVGIINLGTEPKTLLSLAMSQYPEVEAVSPDDVDLPYIYPKDCSMVLDE